MAGGGAHELTVIKLGEERAKMVDKVLDVRQGELCWIVGTVFMEMGLKPNILDDISKEVCLLQSLSLWCSCNTKIEI